GTLFHLSRSPAALTPHAFPTRRSSDLGPRAGATVGLMNMVAQIGGLAGSVLYGYIVERTGSYDAPFIPMAALLLIGAMLWLRVRSEEHTSELQSRGQLVCRLLLEKKKT